MRPPLPDVPPCSETHLAFSHRLALIIATLAVAGAAVSTSSRHAPAAPDDIAVGSRGAGPRDVDPVPFHEESWITPPGHTASAHSSAICALPSGDLFAVWYGGSREGGSDVALFTSRLPAGGDRWAPPARAVDRAMAAEELDRLVKKVGNAVVFPDGLGTLWMVYVSVTVGGWSGSALNLKTSSDEGRTWSESRRLTLNPFLNLSSLVRNKPIFASDGRIGLPVYHELAVKYPQVLWLTPGTGGVVQDYRIRNLAAETDLIQPTLVPLGRDRVLMMLRDSSDERRLHTAYSDDNGWTWSPAQASGLPNPDSAIDGLRLPDGRILIVYNHAASGRGNLQLAISSNDGRTWRPEAVIEANSEQEFSYPCLALDSRGRIHLTYTWHRKRIRHVEFNVAWLDRTPVEMEVASQ